MPASKVATVSTRSNPSNESLDYLTMVKEARKLNRDSFHRTIRLALLTDFASQQFVPLLKVLCARRGFFLEIYEAGYDTIDLEIHNASSGLYQFEPHFVAILMGTQKLKSRAYDVEDRERFSGETIDRITGLWHTLRQRTQAVIIQSNFVMPSERSFGNFELKMANSIGSFFADVNYRIALESRKHSNVLLCDADFLAAEVGRSKWFDDRLWTIAKTYCRLEYLPQFTKRLTDIMVAAQGAIVKCVVLDLDNTLWGGVIGDDGLEGIQLGEYDEGEAFVIFQKFVLELKRRGIILAVVSKNEYENAVLPFRKHQNMVLEESDIAVFIANWGNKADNIKLIQRTLNIGFDSMVFLDDNAFERNIVREYLPEVIVPELPDDPADFIRMLADLNLFEASSFSEADARRVDHYRVEAQRELTRQSYINVNEYLASLQMTVSLHRFEKSRLGRIAQLVQRSNQFNLCTRRYSESACEQLMNEQDALPFSISLADKFGDYGLIAVIVLKIEGQAVLIDEYLMSCRVLQRGVEYLAMNHIFAYARSKQLTKVVGRYIRSAKNDMVKDFYSDFGFARSAEDASGSSWELAVTDYQPKETFFASATVEL